MTLDEILNVVVPILIFLFVIAIVYNKAKDPIDNFFRSIRSWANKGEEGGGESGSLSEGTVWGSKIEYQGGQY